MQDLTLVNKKKREKKGNYGPLSLVLPSGLNKTAVTVKVLHTLFYESSFTMYGIFCSVINLDELSIVTALVSGGGGDDGVINPGGHTCEYIQFA